MVLATGDNARILVAEDEDCIRLLIVEALDRYVERFDFAPMGYFAIESDGRIIESNLAGAELFELERAELEGIPVENLLADESRGILRELLQRLQNGEPDGNCLLRRIPAGGGQRLLLAQVRASSRRLLRIGNAFVSA